MLIFTENLKKLLFMKSLSKVLLCCFLACLISCEDASFEFSDPVNQSFQNEFALLFPGHIGLDKTPLSNGNSVFFYSSDMNNITLSAIDETGTILWTQSHAVANPEIISHAALMAHSTEDKLIAFTTGHGLKKYEYDFDGNMLNVNQITDGFARYFNADDTHFYAVSSNTDGPGTNIEVLKISYEGTIIESNNFNISSQISYANFIRVKNDLVYAFGRHPNAVGPDDDIAFCEIYTLSGSFINRIEVSTPDNVIRHTQRILENGNFMISTQNFNNGNTVSYKIHLYDSQGNYIADKLISASGELQISPISNGQLALAGKEASSPNGPKYSQFVILDANLNEVYRRNIGSLDGAELFYLTKEYSDSYHIYGLTSGTAGDFDLSNNSASTDLFYMKLQK